MKAKKNRTAGRKDRETWLRLLMILLMLSPLFILFLLPSGSLLAGGLWFWLFLLFSLWLIWAMLGTPTTKSEQVMPEGPRDLPAEQQPESIKEVMNVRVAQEESGVRLFRGGLKESTEAVFEKLKRSFGRETVPLVQEDKQLGAAIYLLPRPVEQKTLEKPVRPWVHWLLFALTVLTTTWAGAAHQGVNLLREPARFTVGLPYALALMTILGIHELGHYFMARRHGIRVTPPYFIPIPFALGTFGAFIQMRSPTENRRALFDVAVAGPLAGLVIAIPALLIGLQTSAVIGGGAEPARQMGGMMHGTSVGSSLLLAFLAKLSLGPELLQGHILQLSPLAFAGWLGLFITALNLIPVGQLDGGHIAHAMFGRRIGDFIGTIAMWSLLLLGFFVWPGLLTWAIIIFFIAGRSTPPLNDLTPLTPARLALGYVALLILALIIVPLPHAFWPAARIHCPYL